MYESVTCPKCDRHLQLPAEHMGQSVQCPSCETSFIAGAAKPRSKPKPGAIPVEPAIASTAADIDLDDEVPKRRRRRRPDWDKPAPPTRSWKALWTIVAVVIGGFLSVGWCLIYQFGQGNHANPPFRPNFNAQPPNPNFGQGNIPGNFGPQPPMIDAPARLLTAAEQKQHVQIFFDHFAGMMRNMNNAGESASFDTAQVVEILLDEKLVPDGWRPHKVRLAEMVGPGVLQTSLYRGEHWKDFTIMTVQQPRQGELVVATLHPNREKGLTLRLRWWLTHRDGRWRIKEVEDPDFGVRLSLLLACGMQPPIAGGALVHHEIRAVRDAANAIIVHTNLDEADRILAGVRVADLPKAAAASYHLLLAAIRVRGVQPRWEDALKSCDAAELCQPDTAAIDYMRALSYNSLQRGELALKHIRLARESLGDDPGVCYEFGLALHNLRKFGEAATYYRKVLDDQPDHLDAFLSLLRCLGPDVKNDDVTRRYSRMKRPQDRFEQYAQDRWQNRDAVTLQMLAEVMRKREPNHADANYYLALAHADQQRVAPALTAFRKALAAQPDVFRRDHYYSEFTRTNAFRENALQIYNGLADPVRTFRALAEVLRTSGRTDDLRDLMDAHAKRFPKDEYLELYRAELHLRDEKYELADQGFTKAFATIKDLSVAERFRFSRLRVRYQIGDVLDAYNEIGPKSASFQQLAGFCWTDKKVDDLARLVEAHTKNDPADPQLARYTWRLHILAKRFDEAGKALKTALDRNAGFDADRHLVEDFIFDMLDAGHPLEAYRRAPDPNDALDIIATDFGRPRRGNDLDMVIEEHRKRFPKDPVLLMYAGQQAAAKMEWAKAAQAYRDGWKQLPDAKRLRWTHGVLTAHYKAGQTVLAYHELGKRADHFRQLTTMILRDKDIELFDRLLNAHRPQRALDPEFPAFEARLKILRGKSAEAAKIMIGLLKDRPLPDQRRIGDSFTSDLALFDLAVEAYRCIPDKVDAFSHMTWKYRTPERAKELERLIAEHAQHHPDDLRLTLERGELHMLRNEFALAEQQFLLGTAGQTAGLSRSGLIRARIKLGQAANAYRELGANTVAFQDVASQCVILKDAAQLESLLAAHRKMFPALKGLSVWEVEVHWLKKDYEATVKAIEADRSGLLTNATHRWKCEGYLIRSLVRLKRPDDALREAEAMTKRKDGPQVLLALALASRGDVPRVLAFLETKKADRYFIDDCYYAEDLGPILRGAAFRAVTERFPPPPERLPNVPFDDDWD